MSTRAMRPVREAAQGVGGGSRVWGSARVLWLTALIGCGAPPTDGSTTRQPSLRVVATFVAHADPSAGQLRFEVLPSRAELSAPDGLGRVRQALSSVNLVQDGTPGSRVRDSGQ